MLAPRSGIAAAGPGRTRFLSGALELKFPIAKLTGMARSFDRYS
jgi:hypothetical protein